MTTNTDRKRSAKRGADGLTPHERMLRSRRAREQEEAERRARVADLDHAARRLRDDGGSSTAPGTHPACAGDPRFTDDARHVEAAADGGEDLALATICAACPLLGVCAMFATETQPQGGYWAGAWRGPAPREIEPQREADDRRHDWGSSKGRREMATSPAQTPASSEHVSQERSQATDETPKVRPQRPRRVPQSSRLWRLVDTARGLPCSICRSGRGSWCGATLGHPRRMFGPNMLHVSRLVAAELADEDLAASRVSGAAAVHAAPPARPRPKPSPPRSAPSAPARDTGLTTTLEERLRAVLRTLDRDVRPEAAQAALDDAGVRLDLEAVAAWLDALRGEIHP